MAAIRSSESDIRLRVCVVGVGFVGKSLVDVFSEKYDVVGYDISEHRIQELRAASVPHPRVQYLHTVDGILDCDLYCVSVPTPIGPNGDTVDTRPLEAALQSVKDVARPGSTIVIESTVAVGTTRQQLADMRARGIFAGFSPERIDPGRVSPSAHEIPKIVSGIDGPSLTRINELYSAVFHRVVPVSSVETAEMSKLFENCFRLLNIAYVNEIADACQAHGIDPYEMVAASATKPYGFMQFTPGLGAGGPCIPANPYYLLINNQLPLLEAATIANRERPAVKAAYLLRTYPLASRILVVGVAFKPGQSLTTNSTGLALAMELKKVGRTVAVYDPLVATPGDASELAYLDDDDWSAACLSSRFDLICVAMCQHHIDFGVLAKCKLQVEWLCNRPLSHTAVGEHCRAPADPVGHLRS